MNGMLIAITWLIFIAVVVLICIDNKLGRIADMLEKTEKSPSAEKEEKS